MFKAYQHYFNQKEKTGEGSAAGGRGHGIMLLNNAQSINAAAGT